MRKSLLVLLLPLWLAACGAAEPVWAPEEAVQAAVVPNTGPTSITLVTVLSNSNNSGAHSGLMIDASQDVLFDPAGTFKHPNMPERNDVVYGATPIRKEIYIDYHARVTYRVVLQRLEVSPEAAELVFHKAQAYGAVPKAFCAAAVSEILSTVPGFETVHRTMLPRKLMKEFGEIPGVTEKVVRDEDADDNRYVIYKYTGRPPQPLPGAGG
jgi:hypothetical protein